MLRFNFLMFIGFMAVLFSSSVLQAEEKLPEVNQSIVAFCKKSMNTKIARGQCWDLAKFALNTVEADWKPPYGFGKKVDASKEEILPGDIIQFEKVKLLNGDSYSHHTAIVFKVLEKGKFVMAHQNFAGVEKVTTRELDLQLLESGSIDFYRPQGHMEND